MLSDATSGWNVAAGLNRSSTDMNGLPPVVRLTIQFDRCLMDLQEGFERLRGLIRLACLRMPRMQVKDGRARLRRPDRGFGDFVGGHGQIGRHARCVNRASHRACHDHLVRHAHFDSLCLINGTSLSSRHGPFQSIGRFVRKASVCAAGSASRPNSRSHVCHRDTPPEYPDWPSSPPRFRSSPLARLRDLRSRNE